MRRTTRRRLDWLMVAVALGVVSYAANVASGDGFVDWLIGQAYAYGGVIVGALVAHSQMRADVPAYIREARELIEQREEERRRHEDRD